MIKYSFLLILFLTMLADSWLDLLNIKYGRRKSGSVPEVLKGVITTENSMKSFRYTEDKQIFALVKKTVSSLVLIIVLTAGRQLLIQHSLFIHPDGAVLAAAAAFRPLLQLCYREKV